MHPPQLDQSEFINSAEFGDPSRQPAFERAIDALQKCDPSLADECRPMITRIRAALVARGTDSKSTPDQRRLAVDTFISLRSKIAPELWEKTSAWSGHNLNFPLLAGWLRGEKVPGA